LNSRPTVYESAREAFIAEFTAGFTHVCDSDKYVCSALKYANAHRSDESLTIADCLASPSWASVVGRVSAELQAAAVAGRLGDATRWRQALGLLVDVAGRALDGRAES
jgi:hypothetical protein